MNPRLLYLLLTISLAGGLAVLDRTPTAGAPLTPLSPPAPTKTAPSLVNNDEFTVDAPPSRVFPLLCPVREYDWLPNWQCEILNTASGVAEAECVFRTNQPDSGTMTWVVSRYEPPSCIEFTCFNATAQHVMRLSINLEPTPAGGTRLLWRKRLISTGPAGDALVANFQGAAHTAWMQYLERVLAHYLRTGSMEPPASSP